MIVEIFRQKNSIGRQNCTKMRTGIGIAIVLLIEGNKIFLELDKKEQTFNITFEI